MAILDPTLDAITIRVVYDGAAYAGKTTSIQALAHGFGANSSTPAEVGGRTLYFDWLDYTGGLFEGHRIRCQIISVPGQTMLASRRRYLLETADVVVFVGDSTPESQPATLSYLKGLSGVLGTLDGPPVGIVFQANKRDHEGAVPLSLFRDALDALDLQVGIIESIATEAIGIRETFVFAVRLALDRVRELMRTGALLTTAPEIDSPDQLLSELQKVEGNTLNLAAESGLRQLQLSTLQIPTMATSAIDEAVSDNDSSKALLPNLNILNAPNEYVTVPRIPSSSLPSGMIWPPVNGRIILHEAASDDIVLQLDETGDWHGKANGHWHVHSPNAARFESLELGREALIKWARLHAASTHVISAQRSVVLAEDGMGWFRLWQIIHNGTSLHTEFSTALNRGPGEIAAAVLALSHQVLAAADRWAAAACWLPLNITNIGADAEKGLYLGKMPDPNLVRPTARQSDAIILEGLIDDIGFALPKIRLQRGAILQALYHKIAENPSMQAGDLVWTDKFLRIL